MNNWAGRGWPLRTWWIGSFIGFHTKRLSFAKLRIGKDCFDIGNRPTYRPDRRVSADSVYDEMRPLLRTPCVNPD
jgi:hypothetical protein